MTRRDALFVYGTLMRCHPAHERLRPWAESVAPARIEGYRLLDCGAYPGVRPAEGRTVRGELVVLRDPAQAFEQLDAYEECPGEYVRVRVPVTTDAGVVHEAWAYVLSEPMEAVWRSVEAERWVPSSSSAEGSAPAER